MLEKGDIAVSGCGDGCGLEEGCGHDTPGCMLEKGCIAVSGCGLEEGVWS